MAARRFSGGVGVMAVQLGELVGDYTFVRPDGTPVRLSAFHGRPLLLIFLRHLA